MVGGTTRIEQHGAHPLIQLRLAAELDEGDVVTVGGGIEGGVDGPSPGRIETRVRGVGTGRGIDITEEDSGGGRCPAPQAARGCQHVLVADQRAPAEDLTGTPVHQARHVRELATPDVGTSDDRLQPSAILGPTAASAAADMTTASFLNHFTGPPGTIRTHPPWRAVLQPSTNSQLRKHSSVTRMRTTGLRGRS